MGIAHRAAPPAIIPTLAPRKRGPARSLHEDLTCKSSSPAPPGKSPAPATSCGSTARPCCSTWDVPGPPERDRAKNAALPLEVREIDAVVLSHAHIDHAGRLPLLTAHGYANPSICTAATRDLTAVMLADSAHIQEKDAEFLARRNKEAVPPLYGMRDATTAVDRMVGLPYDTPFDVVPGMRATFTDAGHILGSASITLDCTEGGVRKRIVFSGDIGRNGLPIIRDPKPPAGGADVVLLESTYGNRDHPPVAGARDQLARVVSETAARGGRVLVPAFSVGRTQELVYDLHILAREGKIPEVPIYIDSPLAIDATTVFAMHPEIFDQTEDLVQRVQDLFKFPLVRYTRERARACSARAEI